MLASPHSPPSPSGNGTFFISAGRCLTHGQPSFPVMILAVAIASCLAPCLQGSAPRVELVYKGLENRQNGAVYADGVVALTDFAYDETSRCHYLPMGGFDHEDGRVGSILRLDADGSFKTFLKFTGQYGPIKGRLPRGAVTRGPDGKFYGVTRAGGDADQGTIYRFAGSGEFETVAQFAGTGAAHPTGTLTWGPDGALYGLTTSGGIHNAGTVFRVSASGSLTHFAHLEESTGRHPVEGLTLGSDGAFYGMTDEGGTFGHGTIYRVTSTGQISAVIHFSGNGLLNKGRRAYGRLLNHTDGFLYGVTQRGGSQDLGTVFKLGLDGTFTTLFASFDGTAALPSSSLIAGPDGKLYGATGHNPALTLLNAPARVFSITTAGWLTPLAPLRSGSSSVELRTSLFLNSDGSFLAANERAILKINNRGILADQYHFLDAPRLTSLVVGNDGTLSGSYDDDFKAVPFTLSSGGTLINRARFPLTNSHYDVRGRVALTIDSAGCLHGAIQRERSSASGDLFFTLCPGESVPVVRNVTGVHTTIQLLPGSDGSLYALANGGLYHVPPNRPPRLLLADDHSERNDDGISFGPDGAIYGVTRAEDAFRLGRLYRCTIEGEVTTLYDFADLREPLAPLFPYGSVAFGDDGAIYGVAEQGGGGTNGAVYRYKDGLVRVVALPGYSYPLARGADGRVYGIRPVAEPLKWYWDLGQRDYGMGSGDFEILRFESDLSFTTTRVPRGFLAAPGSLIRGLTPGPDGTLYFFLVPSVYDGMEYYNAIYRLSFGQPEPILSPISELTANAVVLHGSVDPRGTTNVQSYFEIGVSEDKLKLVPAVAGQGQTVLSEIHGLHPDTVYFYRLRSSNSGGTGQTSLATFRTPAGNHLPEFSPFLVRATHDAPTTIPIALIHAAVTDSDGGIPSVIFVRPASDRGGAASLIDGVGVHYQPAAGFAGIDIVSLDITDSQGGRITVLVPVEVVGSPESQARSDLIEVLSTGQLLLVLHGAASKAHLLQTSPDLRVWTEAASATADSEGTVVLIQETAPKATTFFRLALPPG